jgi:chloramphenicol 3-O-phosphotransferase
MQITTAMLILSGPVGAGKTTVAKALIAASPGALAYVEGDTFWPHIVRFSERQPKMESFTMVMRAMVAAARHYDRDGYQVILDFSIPPWYLDAVRKLLKGAPFDYAVLRPSEAACAERAAARAEGAIADYAPYHDLYEAFDGAERFTIADDGADPAAIAARIRASVKAGAFRVS